MNKMPMNFAWSRRLALLAPLLLLSGCNPTPPSESVSSAPSEILSEDSYGGALSGLRGKVVLLDFWATWCGPCRAEIPNEQQLFSRFQGRPFAILGVSLDKKVETLQDFLAKKPVPWPNILDTNGSIAKRWEVGPIPTFILIDHNGNVINKWIGGGQINEIRAAVEQAVRTAERKRTGGA
jgi:thiol-disulfide isomerase/thioredoxin